MPPTVQVLAAAGIQRPAEVVELAAAARLDVACAAVLLLMESGGGRNIWGHDAVATGGAYVKGGPVSQTNYSTYRRFLATGRAGPQGCGPTQLTWRPFQDQADRLGGCWDWRSNCKTGFGILADLIRAHGEQGGFRRYNGAGAAAERYANDAIVRVARLRQQLTSAAPITEDDMPLTPQDLDAIAKAVWAKLTTNLNGQQVQVEQVLNGVEKRLADVQAEVDGQK